MSRHPPLTDEDRARAAVEAERQVRATLERHHERQRRARRLRGDLDSAARESR